MTTLLNRPLSVKTLQSMLNRTYVSPKKSPKKRSPHPFSTSTRPSLSARAEIHKKLINKVNATWRNLSKKWSLPQVKAAAEAAEKLHQENLKGKITNSQYNHNVNFIVNLFKKLSLNPRLGPGSRAYMERMYARAYRAAQYNKVTRPRGYTHGNLGAFLYRELPFSRGPMGNLTGSKIGLRQYMILNAKKGLKM